MKCPSCSAEIPVTSNFCPGCGKASSIGNTPTSQGLSQNIAGMLAYITFIPALIFLMVEPYNKNNFVRFHAFQSIFFSIASIVIQVGLHIAGSFMSFFALVLLPVYGLIGLGFFILWIVCLIKAYGNEKFKLPIIGDLAEQQAGK